MNGNATHIPHDSGLPAAATRPQKPLALLLSHCIPDPFGPFDRARAWQLLCELTRTHAVCLACLVDGPFDWGQWRALDAQTLRLAIVPATAWRWCAAPDLRVLTPNRLDAALQPTLWAWQRQTRFDLVAATHVSLWPSALATPATRHACDLEPRPSLVHETLAAGAAAPERWWRLHLARTRTSEEKALADTCDLAILGDAQTASACGLPMERTALWPGAIDAASFFGLSSVESPAAAPDAPSLVLHADLRFAAARRALRDFTERTWPDIQRAVPAAELAVADAAGSCRHSPQLRHPAVVVCPTAEPLLGRWPIMQALALGQSVVADRRAASGLRAKPDGSALHLADSRDWADLCIQMLRAPHPLARRTAPKPLPAEDLRPQVVTGQALFSAPAPRRLARAA
jgi:hypothetical protein